MPTTIKVGLRKVKNRKDKQNPIVLRITKDRKKRILFTGIYIEPQYWDATNFKVKKSHPNYTAINLLLASKIKESTNIICHAESKNTSYSSLDVKRELLNKTKSASFFEFTNEHLDLLQKRKKFRESEREKSKFKTFKNFLKGKDISFCEINMPLLNRFMAYLEFEKKLSKRSIMNYLMTIRTLYNKAIYEGIATKDNYPFGKNKIIIKKIESNKIGLNEAEISAIEALEFKTNSLLYLTQTVFLSSFYFAGMRIGDVMRLKWKDFVDDRLIYRMGKNDKIVSIKVPLKVMSILDYYKQYKQSENDYVFPMLKSALKDEEQIQKRINTYNKILNYNLKKIAKLIGTSKNISCHIARHSFGNIAGNKIPIYILQKLYRHSNMSTTAIYQQNFIHKDTDMALDNVLDF